MFCNKCGKEVPEGSVFCNFCGAEVPASVRQTTPDIKEQPEEDAPPVHKKPIKNTAKELKKTEEPPKAAIQQETPESLPSKPGETDGEKAKTKKTVLIISIAAGVVLIGVILTGILLMNRPDGNQTSTGGESFQVSRETAAPVKTQAPKKTANDYADDDFLDALQQSVLNTMKVEARGDSSQALAESYQKELGDLEAFRNKSFSDDSIKRYMEKYLSGLETQINAAELEEEAPSEFQIQWQTGGVERLEALTGLNEGYGFMKSNAEFKEHYLDNLEYAAFHLEALQAIENDLAGQTHGGDFEYFLDGRKFYFKLTNHTSYTYTTYFKLVLSDSDYIPYFEDTITIKDIKPNETFEVAFSIPSESKFRDGHWQWWSWYDNITE